MTWMNKGWPLPMRHHFKSSRANGINDLSSFFCICNFKLLLQENRSLLIGGFDNPGNEDVVWRRRRWMKQ
jgi:hypothetical protein